MRVATSPRVGPCRLCLHQSELRDSHLLAKAFYRLIRGTDKTHPMLMTAAGTAVPTSQQVRGHQFCGDCEQRLNRLGEGWVLRNCWRTDAEFPLREALARAGAVLSGPEGAAFAGTGTPGVGVDKLAYFGVSIFWRATLTGWRAVLGQPLRPLDLGPYSERLRVFLLEEGPFPEHVSLRIFVTASTEAVPHRSSMTSPHALGKAHGAHWYRFTIPGLTYDLMVGRAMDATSRSTCNVRGMSRPIFVLPVVDQKNYEAALDLYAKTRRARGPAKQ